MLQPNMGFLKCATKVLSPDFSHGNTDVLFQQVAKVPDGTHTAVIVGHGGPGLQCTGMGDSCPGHPELELGYWNQNTWQQYAAKIRSNFKSVTLLGCEVGKASNGITLLRELAQTIQLPVRAPNSFVFCDKEKGIYLDDGGRWVEISPQQMQPRLSTSVAKPSQATVSPAPPGEYKFNIHGTMTNVPAASVEVLDFKHRSYQDKDFRSLPRSAFDSLKNLIDFAHPLLRKGSPAAIVTGVLRIQISVDSARDVREFLLLNDSLVADTVETGVYYRASDELSQTIEALLK